MGKKKPWDEYHRILEGKDMKTKTIITDGLAAMADEQEFRRWIAGFDCILTGDLLYSWSEGRKHFGHSLAELAFELEQQAMATDAGLRLWLRISVGDAGVSIVNVNDVLALATVPPSIFRASIETRIVNAIAALEGE